MCKVKTHHNWYKCGELESIDRNELDFDERNKPGHMVKQIMYDVGNVTEECDKCKKLRREEGEKKKAQES